MSCLVVELNVGNKHPLQQGLRRGPYLIVKPLIYRRKQTSTTTRIATVPQIIVPLNVDRRKQTSTTTRIATASTRVILLEGYVGNKHPLQQGLRR